MIALPKKCMFITIIMFVFLNLLHMKKSYSPCVWKNCCCCDFIQYLYTLMMCGWLLPFFCEHSHFKPHSIAMFSYFFYFSTKSIYMGFEGGFSERNSYQNTRKRLSKWIIYQNIWSWLLIDRCGRKNRFTSGLNLHTLHFKSTLETTMAIKVAKILARLWPKKNVPK